MNALCASAAAHPYSGAGHDHEQKYRAAETSEIMLRTVEGCPPTNTAEIPLMGTCPNCEGDDDEAPAPYNPHDGSAYDDSPPRHASGHARVCWDPAAPLTTEGRRTDCHGGKKAILCVIDQALPSVQIPYAR